MIVYFVVVALASVALCDTSCPKPLCGKSEIYVKCRTICPPQSCNISYTTYRCDNNTTCEPGCDCIKDYLRDDCGVCVLNDKCLPPPIIPECGKFEEPTDCVRKEPCKSGTQKYKCIPGCKCKDKLVRNKNGLCVPDITCGKNEEPSSCIHICPPRKCIIPRHSLTCRPGPCQAGCECIDGYVRDENNKCILKEKCPPDPNQCRQNETLVNCYVGCPTNHCPTNDNQGIIACDPPQPCKSGCACKANYKRLRRTKKLGDDRCILASDCPPVNCTRQHEVWNPCPEPCFSDTCKDLNRTSKECDLRFHYCKPQCVCEENYRRNNSNICVPIAECPPSNLTCGRNEESSYCKQVCPPQRCDWDPKKQACKPGPCQPGCNCINGYLRDKDGNCIRKEECPINPNQCRQNETLVNCYVGCPTNYCPTNDNRAIIACDPPRPCKSGCACKANYKRLRRTEKLGDERCILASECPPVNCTRQHEVWNPCPEPCFSDTCRDLSKTSKECNLRFHYCKPQCVCEENYRRNNSNICVPVAECPPSNLTCGRNEEPSYCKQVCPPQRCDWDPKKQACKPGPCQPGCNCIKGYLRDTDGNCIHKDECPISPDIKCGKNEEPSNCKKECPPQRCDWDFELQDCKPVPCKPGCNCIEGYLRDTQGNCIPKDQCPPSKSCNGDKNATYVERPIRCKSTCKYPNAKCDKTYGPCECNPGYILSEDGKCILLEDCPGGNPCRRNETFVSCKVGCPTNYCPVNDNRFMVACAPPYPCPSGCACKANYKRLSGDDDQCILASDCPPVNCTRQYEVWNPCPAPCTSDRCSDLNKPLVKCSSLVNYCQPQCVCEENYRRNNSGVCVPVEECPPPDIPCGKNEEPSNCKIQCPPQTCDWDPTKMACKPGPCQRGCNCIKDHLRDEGGNCIPKEQCPKTPQCGEFEEPTDCADNIPQPKTNTDIYLCLPGCKCIDKYIRDRNGTCVPDKTCNGDKNATYSKSPIRCKSTCKKPNSKCDETYGPCECNSGYILSDEGKCILPQDCPGGSPCRQNETFVSCLAGCPPNYCPVNDNRFMIPCMAPFRCPSGCACNANYTRLNGGDNRCILSAECPPVNCTRQNEVWDPCPPSCISDWCSDLNKALMVKCVNYCQPQCVCEENYRRNNSGVCVPVEECPPPDIPCGKNEEPSNCKIQCPPQTCDWDPTKMACKPGPCQRGCNCIKDHLRDEGGNCIPKDQCPKTAQCGEFEEPTDCADNTPQPGSNTDRYICRPGCKCIDKYVRDGNGTCVLDKTCNGDKNATYSEDPIRCKSTCKNPNAKCDQKYGPCECNFGYTLSDEGKCILPQDCPSGNPCGQNETFVACNVGCPTNYCPVDDNRALIACDPPYPCPSGCACQFNHKRISRSDERCIFAADCPPVNCTRQNEVWSPCPGPCFSDKCSDQLNPNKICVASGPDCEPQCVCKDNYCRNDSDICVPTAENAPKCGKFEEPTDCADNSLDQYGYDSEKCQPGCKCIGGYLRDINGTCSPIPSDLQCGKNEEPTLCVKVCFPQRCNIDPLQYSMTCKPGRCQPGCQCIKGHVRDKTNTCIPKEKCSPNKTCNGDKNATYSEDPIRCKSTCKNPNAKCDQKYGPCECNFGYTLSDEGTCILPQDCPSGNPCRQNETFVACNVGCPTNYCPVDDNRSLIACDPPYPCPSGCACQFNHKRISRSDERCIFAADCPPVNCTRQNEVWSPCPGACFSDKCSDQPNPEICMSLLLYCEPQCVCKDKYCRNDSDICVPIAENVPKCGEFEEPTDCADSQLYSTSNTDRYVCRPGCKCIDNYVYDQNGKCIPEEKMCNGDRNATYSQNQSIRCKSTCKNPNAVCDEKYGPCECKPGYILSDEGKCILSEDCPGGSPCSQNETFVYCNAGCPTNYCPVDDNRDIIVCDPPYPCPPGCACQFNYKHLSEDDNRCIFAADCPPVNCTRQNEVWNSCPGTCFSDKCSSLYNPTQECLPLLATCEPQCVCEDNYCRDDETDICVPISDCAADQSPRRNK